MTVLKISRKLKPRAVGFHEGLQEDENRLLLTRHAFQFSLNAYHPLPDVFYH
jgi:hypothetical protein